MDFLYILRSIIFSPEFVILILFSYLYHNNSDYFVLFFDKLKLLTDSKIVLLAPLSLVYSMYKLTNEILFAKDKENQDIYKNFPGYWKINFKLYYAWFVLCISFVIADLSYSQILHFKQDSNNAFLFFTSWAMMLTVIVTVAHAAIKRKQILY